MTKIHSYSISLRSDYDKNIFLATSDLALKSAEYVCKDIEKNSIDAVLFGTMTRDYVYPSSACMLTSKLGITSAFAFDVESDFTSFINALILAKAFIDGGRYNRILVVAADMMSTFTDNPMFSDGAVSMLLSSDLDGHELIFADSTTDGSKLENCYIPMGGSAEANTKEGLLAGRNKIHIKNENVFTDAAKEAPSYYKDTFTKNNLNADVYACPYNTEKSSSVFKEEMNSLNMHEIYSFGDRCFGAASAGISFVKAIENGIIKKDSTAAICAYGSGNTMGIALVKF